MKLCSCTGTKKSYRTRDYVIEYCSLHVGCVSVVGLPVAFQGGCYCDCASKHGKSTSLPALQDIIQCILKPATVTDTITKLAATTFAQPIEKKMLSVMVPLLVRGLRERNTAIKRQTAVIISNMVKLVENPADVAPFMATLLPEVDKIGKEISDPNARAVAVNTHALLVKAAGSEDGRAALEEEKAKRATPDVRPALDRFNL
jgi:hypothetical protein